MIKFLRLPSLVFVLCTPAMIAQSSVSPSSSGNATLGPTPSTYNVPESRRLISPEEADMLRLAIAPEYRLQPEDVIKLNVLGVKDFDIETQLAEDGTVPLPLLGAVKLGGLTPGEASRLVDGLLISQDLIHIPGATIQIKKRPHYVISVSGSVTKPGTFPAESVRTVQQALALAGDLKDTASSVITLSRPGVGKFAIPLSSDPASPMRALPVFAGDELSIASVGYVYVVGALRAQGAYPLKNLSPLTAFEAATLAGGMGYEAAADSAQVVRTTVAGKRIMVPVHLAKIMKGREPDFILQNDDILYVPTNKAKAAIKAGAASLIVSLASTYILAVR